MWELSTKPSSSKAKRKRNSIDRPDQLNLLSNIMSTNMIGWLKHKQPITALDMCWQLVSFLHWSAFEKPGFFLIWTNQNDLFVFETIEINIQLFLLRRLRISSKLCFTFLLENCKRIAFLSLKVSIKLGINSYQSC